ncbi:chaperonin [Culex quinquefasciatus]|uniref:Chaperonin n=1 Tax=Culex quinquefasciatus TaxID=7176 RepID=B0XBX0_CULQU|nr:chaperonin [Culex quinquefasciatus]|eukprot:XP_001867142.1 chaperonin [Culex quinquefasciatus]
MRQLLKENISVDEVSYEDDLIHTCVGPQAILKMLVVVISMIIEMRSCEITVQHSAANRTALPDMEVAMEPPQ